MNLSYFRPNTVIPYLLKNIYGFFDKNELNLSNNTVLRILNHIIKPLLTRDIYKPGLYEIPKILNYTLQYLSASDMK